MTGIEVARHVKEHGAHMVRLREPITEPLQYDVKEMFTGNKKGWFVMDSYSGSAILSVHSFLNPVNQAKLEKLRLDKMSDVAYKVLNKTLNKE